MAEIFATAEASKAESSSGNFGNSGSSGNNESNGSNSGSPGNNKNNKERKFMMFVRKALALTTILLICVGLLGCLGCAQTSPPQEPASLDFSTNGPGDPNQPKPVPDFEEQEFTIAPMKLNPSLIYQANESIDDGDLVFSNPRCYRTGELPTNISADEMGYFEGDLAEGTSSLAEGKEYLFVDVDIANISSADVVYNVGSLTFVYADSNYLELGDTGEVRYFSAGEDRESKGFYNLSFAPNEQKIITFGYVFDKAKLGDNSLYFAVAGSDGAMPVDENPSETVDDDRRCFALQL